VDGGLTWSAKRGSLIALLRSETAVGASEDGVNDRVVIARVNPWQLLSLPVWVIYKAFHLEDCALQTEGIPFVRLRFSRTQDEWGDKSGARGGRANNIYVD
jgi:hypothetical protein